MQRSQSSSARPNPSLKRNANGRLPGPVWRDAVDALDAARACTCGDTKA